MLFEYLLSGCGFGLQFRDLLDLTFDDRLHTTTAANLRLNIEFLTVFGKVFLAVDVEFGPELMCADNLRVLVVLEAFSGHISCEEALAAKGNFSMVSVSDGG